jgi:ankyrin repeat protein
MLIDAGANKDVQDARGRTPLHRAASNGRVEVLRVLIDAGARKDIRDNEGKRPIDLADTYELKKLLNPNLSESFDSYDPYELMIIPPNKKAEMIKAEFLRRKQNLDLIENLITLGANLNWRDESSYDRTLLHFTVVHNHPIVTEMLIDAGVDLESTDVDNRTALHLAVRDGKSFISDMLIEAGANANAQDKWNNIPLHIAAYDGNTNIAQILIGAGSELNVQDSGGNTPLHDAVEQDNEDIVILLLKAGARTDIQNEYGKIPYDLAETEEMKKLLKP